MKPALAFLLVLLLQFGPCINQTLAQDFTWMAHFQAAEKAYGSNNLFEARRMFMIALKEAGSCRQHAELASRVEGLAAQYKAADREEQAAPLLKLVRKLRAKSDVAS